MSGVAGAVRPLLQWLRRDKRAGIAAAFLLLVTAAAVFAPLLARHDPAKQEVFNILQSPSGDHWLGTDDVGRDVFARLLFGARTSLTASVLAVAIAMVIGVPLGLISGWVGGWVDAVIMRIVDTMLAFPGIVLAIGIIAALGPGLTNAMVAIGVVFSPSTARLIRGQVLTMKERLYVDAARSYGAPARRILVRHVLPNSVQPVIVQATILLGLSLLVEASLSFLGLGVQPPEPSWGGMLNRAFQFVSRSSIGIYVPGAAIALTVLAINSLGDAMRDALDPTMAARTSRRSIVRRSTPPVPDGGPGPALDERLAL
jgi:peptide/nickel transport system permease protein